MAGMDSLSLAVRRQPPSCPDTAKRAAALWAFESKHVRMPRIRAELLKELRLVGPRAQVGPRSHDRGRGRGDRDRDRDRDHGRSHANGSGRDPDGAPGPARNRDQMDRGHGHDRDHDH